MNVRSRLAVAFVFTWLAGVNLAQATDAGCRVLGVGNDFNALVFGDFRATSSDVEGRLAAQGVVDLNHYSIADKLSAPYDGASLIVGGNLVFPSGRVHAGDIVVGGSAQALGSEVRNGLGADQTVDDHADLPLDFAAEQQRLVAQSQAFAQLPANASWESQFGGLALHGDGSSALQVFALPGQLVLDAHTFAVDGIPAGATVLFNISGAQAGLTDMSLESLVPHRRRVLFNFHQAQSLTLAGISVEGSILAPGAAIANPQGVVKGSVIAASWNGMMQLNHEPFEGCGLPTGEANQPPQIVTEPERLGTVGAEWSYDVHAVDPDLDTLVYSLTLAPPGAQIDATTGLIRWTPDAAHEGDTPFVVHVSDGSGGDAEQDFFVRVLPYFCPIYPIALPDTQLVGLAPGALIDDLPRGTGADTFNWLSWSGEPDPYTLARSLAPPGDSYLYTNPDDASDNRVDVGDWVEAEDFAFDPAATSSKLAELIDREIVVPVWGSTRDTAGTLAYRTVSFANVRLRDFELGSSTSLDIEYLGAVDCYDENDAPIAHDQTLITPRNTALPITLRGSDPEDDALQFALLSAPQHGTVSGTGPDLIYTPDAGYVGPDAFTFRVSDGEFTSAPATVSITVIAVNLPPIADDLALETRRDVPVSITLTGSDPDNDTLGFRVIDAPSHGTLQGSAPALVYTPAAGYVGADVFHYVVNDGEFDSAPATVSLTVRRTNSAPQIVSPAVTVVRQDQAYVYDVDAVDPESDPLTYALDVAPAAMTIAGASGVIGWTPNPAFAQSVRDFNSQCYVVPDGVEQEGNDPVFITPLYQRVRDAIAHGSDYVAPQTVAWHNGNGCLGCHVQTQAVVGLQASKSKADVDEAAAEFLLSELFRSQQPDGSIRLSHPEFAGNQTAFALWALSYVPERERTLAARARGLTFLAPRRQNSGAQSWWNNDHPSGWLGDAPSMTALVALTASRYIDDVAVALAPTPAQLQTAIDYRAALPRIAEFFLGRSATTASNLELSFSMLGLAELRGHLSDAALGARVDARLAAIDTTLRARQQSTGGWGVNAAGGSPDPLTSAWVGFALDTLEPPLTDPVVRANIEYLLDTQRADGTWLTTSGLFATHLATTSLVMAYLPVALEHLGNPDLALGHLELLESAGNYTLRGETFNRGLAPATGGITVRFFDGPPALGQLLGEATLDRINSGETRWVSIPLAAGSPSTNVHATIVASDEIGECLTDNNATSALLIEVRASDPDALFDQQRYLLNVLDANAAPVIVSQPQTVLSQGRPYEYRVVVSDADVGDAHNYQLLTAPAGLYLDSHDGDFSYDVTLLPLGTHRVVLRAFDLRGAMAEQSFDLQVLANAPPVITSTPVLEATVGAGYLYPVTATDADGDTLTYTLALSPLTMAIGESDGVIDWTPLALHVGSHEVTVRVRDGRGGEATQTFTVLVSAVQANRPPQISTTPPPSVDERASYSYDVDATDPDADVLAYALQRAPNVSTINAASGMLGWTGNSTLVAGIRAPHLGCRVASASADSGVAELWSWTGDASEPSYDQVIATPLVVRLSDGNGDGTVDALDTPDVLIVNYSRNELAGGGVPQGLLRAIDGGTGQQRWATSLSVAVDGFGTPAVGDIDADGAVDIVAPSATGGVIAFERDGSVKWSTPALHTLGRWGRIVHLADLDGDGQIEILVDDTVLSSDGDLLWRLSGNAGYNAWYASGVSAIADIDGNGTQEILAGATAYGADGTVLWANASIGDGYTAIADFDADGEPEIVVVRNGLSVLRADGSVMWGPVAIPGGGEGGPPTVGDFDGDGLPEIGVAGSSRYAAFDTDGSVLWSAETQDGTSRVTGSTVFDLEGDGRVEVLYNDERYFRILDGVTGAVRYQSRSTSGTAFEYPVAADVDNDGHAEIVVVSNEFMQLTGRDVPPGTRGVRVLRSAGAPWAPTRAIWNQHAYHVDNVADDGSIPAQPAPSWLAHNTFRLNTFADGDPLGLPDLALFDLRLEDGAPSRILLTVVNRGLLATTAHVGVTVHSGDPLAGGALLGTIDVPPLAAGASLELDLDLADPTLVDADLHAAIDAGNAVHECVEDNNRASAALFALTATDPDGLFDAQRFSVTVGNVNEAPTLPNQLLPPATGAIAYRYTLSGSDPDLGDGLRYSIEQGPPGLWIEPVSGELRWTPQATDAGTHPVTVRLTDLGGLSVTRSYSLLVSANRAPQISSTPGLAATVGIAYQYDTQASDADGDPLSYSLTAAPAGMSIDAGSGLIAWTPLAAQIGVQDVSVRVDDDQGGFAIQSFGIAVNGPQNHPPEIVSTPGTTARPGNLYRYLIDANDPDGDAMSVSLPVHPPGMTLNEFNGEISWTPTAAQLGPHAVRVEVIDGRGGTAVQDFSIVVQSGGSNVGPSIVSTPGFAAKVGRVYAYDVNATDADGDTLVYSLVQQPAGMTIDGASGAIAWTPAATGTVPVRVRASDGAAFSEQSWSITVGADLPFGVVIDIAPTPPRNDAPITISVGSQNPAGPVVISVTLDGQPLPLGPGGQVQVNIGTPGPHTLVVSATDGVDTVEQTRTINVVDGSDSTPPTVEIHSPVEGANDDLYVVTEPTDVIGSVADDNLVSWTLALVERGTSYDERLELASGTGPVDHSVLGEIDPTRLLNGQWMLRLEGRDASGNVGEAIVGLSVEGDLKLGHFSITFEDLNVPVAGIPVSVSRTYDTRQRHRNLDFGHGWNVAYQNVRIHESRRPGFAWQLNVYPSGPLGLVPNWCVESALGNVVSVTLPNGDVEKFRARAFPECQQGAPSLDVELRFAPAPGTQGRLVVLENNFGRLINESLADPGDPGEPLDPDNYRYIDADGTEFALDQDFGLREIRERAGNNVITFGHDGIVHSNGLSVDFVRDAADRITQVIAPDGALLRYEYDDEGNLEAFVDAEGNTTSFTYLAGHYLRDIIDPEGVRVSRNEYDDDGRLVAVIDADGNRMEYTHDIDGRVEQVRDRNGGITIHVYNDRGDILVETNALGQSVTRTYDDNGNTLTETDALGNEQSWAYDGLGNVVRETNAEGETITHEFGVFNQLQRSRNSLGQVILSQFFLNTTAGGVPIYPGPLTSVTDAAGAATGFGYDPATGQVTSVTDPTGATTRTEYGAGGFVVAQIDPLGHRIEYVNDELGRVLEERRSLTLPGGGQQVLTTRHTYDANGNLVATEAPDGGTVTMAYDASNRLVESCDALARCTLTDYDARGNVASVTHPDGSVESRTYDPHGNVLSETDRDGHTTRYVYDAAHRLHETIYADDTPAPDDNPRTRNLYDVAGRLSSSFDENGRETVYDYDGVGRRTAVTNALGQSTLTSYDALGREETHTDAAGRVLRFVRDAAGRVTETVFPDPAGEDADPANNPRVRTTYDAAGRKLAETDEAGRVTRFVHDAAGRLLTVVQANPLTGANPPLVAGNSPDAGTLVTRHAYDELGNKLQQIDAEGRVTRWEYDAMGRETARILPLGQRESRVYNVAGELQSSIDFEGALTHYMYDVAGRVTTIDYPVDADVTFGYTPGGKRLSIVDAQGTTEHAYDARDRLTRIEYPDGRAIEYTYDAVGNKIGMTTGAQAQAFEYDELNRLVQVERLDGVNPVEITRYAYDDVGNREALIYPNGTRTSYAYDARNRLRSLTHRSADAALLLGIAYDVDASGLRTSVTESDDVGLLRTTTYAYDAAKRLTAETVDARDAADSRATSWTYDRVGNRLAQSVVAPSGSVSTSYEYDANDRLLGQTVLGGVDAGTSSYSYDDNGSTIERVTPNGTTTYAYNDARRLQQATDGEGTSTYLYSADGIRVRQQRVAASTTTSDYLVDPNHAHAQVIEEWTAQGVASPTLAATYTLGEDRISQHRGNQIRYYHTDGLGSTRLLTDAGETITDRYVYAAFGELDEAASSVSSDNLFRYTGEQFDPNLGFYYLRARFYDPAAGRFTRMDDFLGVAADPVTLHKYLYANASPVVHTDPSGHFSLGEMNASLNVMTRLAMTSTRTMARSFIKRAASVAARTAHGLRNLMTQCRRNRERCDLDTSAYMETGDLAETSQHVRDAQLGAGTNLISAGFEFHRINPTHSRRWLTRTAECNPAARTAYAATSGARGVCDEFPYASTREGGERHHPARVSLRMLPRWEQNVQGGKLGAFYGACGVTPNHPKKSRFYVLGAPEVPLPFFICADDR